MNGFEHLKEQVKDQKDSALLETIDYLLTRKDLEKAYLKEDKSVEKMCDYIYKLATKHKQVNKWNWIKDDVVFAWAVMYFTLPDKYLDIKDTANKKQEKIDTNAEKKDNIVSLEKAKQKIEENKVKQLSLFGGAVNE